MNTALRRFLTIVLGCVALACLLGICLDLVTANVAVEYFSVHHPRIVPTENPWALAVIWGIAASWWFGAIAGGIVAAINHRRQHPLQPRRLVAVAMAHQYEYVLGAIALVTIAVMTWRSKYQPDTVTTRGVNDER